MSSVYARTPSFVSPVRAGSRYAGIVRPMRFSRQEGVQFIVALERYAETLRRKGQRTGAAGTISFGAIRLAQILMRLAVKNDGRVVPSVAWLAKELNVACKSIHAWKAQLQEHGFLSWARRYVRVGTPGAKGPQLRQTSNAYSLRMPTKARRIIDALWRIGGRQKGAPKPVAPALAAALTTLGNRVDDAEFANRQRELPEASRQTALINSRGEARSRCVGA